MTINNISSSTSINESTGVTHNGNTTQQRQGATFSYPPGNSGCAPRLRTIPQRLGNFFARMCQPPVRTGQRQQAVNAQQAANRADVPTRPANPNPVITEQQTVCPGDLTYAAVPSHHPAEQENAQASTSRTGSGAEGALSKTPSQNNDKPSSTLRILKQRKDDVLTPQADAATIDQANAQLEEDTSSSAAVGLADPGNTEDVSPQPSIAERRSPPLQTSMPGIGVGNFPNEIWQQVLAYLEPADQHSFLRVVGAVYAPNVIATLIGLLNRTDRALAWPAYLQLEPANPARAFTAQEKFHFLAGAFLTLNNPPRNASPAEHAAFRRAQSQTLKLMAPLWPQVGEVTTSTLSDLISGFPPSRNLQPEEARNWMEFLSGALAHASPEMGLELAARLWFLVYPRHADQAAYPDMRKAIAERIDEAINRTDIMDHHRTRLEQLRDVQRYRLWSGNRFMSWEHHISWDVLAQLIRVGHLHTFDTIVLRDRKLTSIPPEVFDLPNLKKLSVSHNPDLSLAALIDALNAGKCRHLEKINLAETGIRSIPPDIFDLPNLKELNVSSNEGLSLDTLSAAVRGGKLQKLQVLKLHECGIEEVPAEIVGLPGLKKITNGENHENVLAALRTHANLPPPAHVIDTLKSFSSRYLALQDHGVHCDVLAQLIRDGHLQSVERLDLSHAKMAVIPPQIFDLPNLRRLEVSFNPALSLATLIDAINTGKCRQLAEINLMSTGVRSIPPEVFDLPNLEDLNVSYNEGLSLDTLAAAARGGKLQKLQFLDLYQCGFEQVPAEIVGLPSLKKITKGKIYENALPALRALAQTPTASGSGTSTSQGG